MVWNLIKETVDAVRQAELEADKIIAQAKEDAQNKKTQIKTEGENYRIQELSKAERQAQEEMKKVMAQCDKYNAEKDSAMEEKVSKLKADADAKCGKAVDCVISALV